MKPRHLEVLLLLVKFKFTQSTGNCGLRLGGIEINVQ
jgi:hypothetical protein